VPPPRALSALLVLAVLLAARPAGATQEFRFEGTAFEPPGGWDPVPNLRPGVWQIQRTIGEGRDRGRAAIQVSRPIPASQGAFDAVFEHLAGGVTGLEERRPTGRGAGVTAAGHRIRHESRCCARRGDVSVGIDTVGISDGRRHAILVLIGFGLRGDAARRARADFDALVRSFRLDAAEPPAALTPPPGAGGLEGTYGYLRTGITPNAFGGTDFRADNEVRVFDRGGLFSNAVPPGGRDVPAHCRATPTDCGTYRLLAGGTRIELREMGPRYGVIGTEEHPFARDGEGFRIDGLAHRRVPPLPRGTVFDGTWRYFHASSGSTAFSSGGVSSERILTLSPDGRFTRTGSGGVTTTSEAGGARTGFAAGRARPAEAGRYEAEGYRLILTGEDGRREDLSLVLPDPGSRALLVIDGDNYLRRDGPPRDGPPRDGPPRDGMAGAAGPGGARKR